LGISQEIGVHRESCVPAELANLREIFVPTPEAAPPAGWEAVRSFESDHGITLPEPYRTSEAEVRDGLRAGPLYYGLLPLVCILGRMASAQEEEE
jgi:hypothetical protein